MSATGAHLTIGQVVEKLRITYPDLSVSKVRFLEDEGLVTPERTTGGYRIFSSRDIERIDAILRLQKLHFFPLAVIRTKLAALDRGEAVPELETVAGAATADEMDQVFGGSKQSLQAVTEITGAPASFMRDLAQFGVIAIEKGEASPVVDGGSIGLVKAAWELKSMGVDPRHLRPFAQAADREAVLVSQIVGVAGRMRTPEAKKHALDQLRLVEGLTDTVKRSLLKRAMDRELDL